MNFGPRRFQAIGYGTERMRQKLFVVGSGVLVNTSTPACIGGIGRLRHPVGR